MLRFLKLIILLSPILLISQTYKVIKIKDGDTICLLMNGKEEVVRLAHIDSPEKKQPFGNKAKQFVSDLCFGKYVKIGNNLKRDRNKRILAEIILPNGNNVNKELVENGLAWHLKKYSKDNIYAQLEIKARSQKTGLWKDKNPIARWNWRKSSKSSLPSYSFYVY